MGVKSFAIEYDQKIFLPDQRISGKVLLSVDESIEISAVDLKLSGKAKCRWWTWQYDPWYSYPASYSTDFDDNRRRRRRGWGRGRRRVRCDAKEIYLKMTLTLAGGGQKFQLPIGDYDYPFAVTLPPNLPPSFSGKHGSISYYGEAKLDLPWALDKSKKKFFTLQNPIDLNKMPELNQPFYIQQKKMFCCWCCTSGPLMVAVHVPRFGFAYTEAVPITIDVENGSRVTIDSIKVRLNKITNWRAERCYEAEKTKMKTRVLAGVRKHTSYLATEIFQLGPDKYPHTENCGIIQIKYELEIEMVVHGFHRSLTVEIPITIGDIPFTALSDEGVEFLPPQLDPPPGGFGFNPDPAV